MCYSAQIVADYKKMVRHLGAIMSIKEFVKVFYERAEGAKLRIPKAMELAFSDPQTDDERRAKELIERFNRQQTTELEQALFAQRKRLAEAERSLESKVTKTASESKRIASDKIAWHLAKLADLRRTELQARDSRIFPGWYAPVLVVENGQRVIKPMRYLCRPAGKPAFYDTKFPGTYNARRDNLEKFWKGLFGFSHGVMLASAFYENVSRPGLDGQPTNVVLEFKPNTGADMLVACLWSRWTAPGLPELLSFAAITDEPPEEVAAAGHDRCIVPIKAEHVDAWLNPDSNNLSVQQAILDDRQRPYYQHQLAA